MNSPDFRNFESKFELKIDRNMSGKDLKLMMQKVSIVIWNRLCKEVTPTHNSDIFPRQGSINSSMDLKNNSSFLNNTQALLFVLTEYDIFSFQKQE